MEDLANTGTPPTKLRGDVPPAVSMGDLTVLRSLGMANLPSIVVATDRSALTLRSRHAHAYCLVPGFAAPAMERTADLLIALGRRLKPFVSGKMPLYYGTGDQLAFVHAYSEPLSESFLFLLNNRELGRAIADRELFHDLARRAELPVPRVARGDDLEEVASLRCPLRVRPKRRCIDEGAKWSRGDVFATIDELVNHPLFLSARRSLIVEEHIVGGARDLYSFHGFVDQQGDLLAHYVGRTIRTYPRNGGASSFVELVNDPNVTDLGDRVIRRLGVRGVFKVDMIRDERDGALYVLGVDARFNPWNYLGAMHGVNLPAIAHEYLAFGHAPEPIGPLRPRYRWLHLARDFQAYREERRDEGLSFSRWARSIASRRNVYEAFAWTDPEPFAFWVLEALRRRACATFGSAGLVIHEAS